MGNCIKRGSRMQWGGEDWGQAIAPPAEAVKPEALATGADRIGAIKGSSLKRTACTEVKVKITKKQLEEVIGKMEIDQGLTVQQVLEQLMKVSARFEARYMMTSSAWKPRLQSIPELNSFHSR